MCMFAAPADVSETSIYVGFTKYRQITIYEMSVKTSHSNAMILPVPRYELDVPLEFISMDSDKDRKFFQALDRSVNMTLSFGGTPRSALPILNIGDYRVSVAETLEEIEQVDSSFSLSPDTKATLEKHYKTGFRFVVVALKQGGRVHPIGYVSSLVDGKVFIPTRHEHGKTSHQTEVSRYQPAAEWDHKIYIQGRRQPVTTDLPGWNSLVTALDAVWAQEIVPKGIFSAFPDDFRVSDDPFVFRLRIRGGYLNTDLHLTPV